jgi:hypothetical protein
VSTARGPVGLWTFALDRRPWAEAKDAAAEIDEMGWSVMDDLPLDHHRLLAEAL